MRFYDGLERRFIPYKGWMKVNKDASVVRDELTYEDGDEGPYKIIDNIEAFYFGTTHGHVLYNLKDSTEKLILSKWVRKITYYSSLGYYLIEDNNEDELLPLRDVKGGFRLSDYREWYSVVTEDGNIIEDSCLINSLRRLNHRGFCGRFNVGGFVIEDGRWLENEKCDKDMSNYSAAMWADSGIWGMNVINDSGYKHLFYGQGDMIINYAHEVLCSKIGTIFLKKDSWWYLRFLNGRMMKCFCDE